MDGQTTVTWYPWPYRIDFIVPAAAYGTTFEDEASSLPDAVVNSNPNASAVSYTLEGPAFRLLSLSCREWARHTPSPLAATSNSVTRTQIQDALGKIVRRPNNAWWALNELRPLLHATPVKLRRQCAWMEAARATAKIAEIFRAQYRDAGESRACRAKRGGEADCVVRFAVAVHQLADFEHAHVLPFEEGLWLTHPFDDYFLRPPPFYSPPSLLPPSRTWVFQATEYMHAHLGENHGEYEYIQGIAMVLAANTHRKALEALNAGQGKP